MIKGKNNIEGYCAICGDPGTLTKDHVPPKGCIEICAVEIDSFRDALNQEKSLPKYSQNGVKFQTICDICNSVRLGGQYDNEIKNLVNQVVSYYRPMLEARIALPAKQKITIKAHRLARAVIGHLLAASLDHSVSSKPHDSPFDNTLRDYFLNSHKEIPREIEIYYWLYPSKNQLILKGFGLAEMGTSSVILGHIIKFYPVAFWVVYRKPDNLHVNHNRLVFETSCGIDHESVIDLDYSNVPPLNWPENPRDHEIVLFNNKQIVKAKPRSKNRKLRKRLKRI